MQPSNMLIDPATLRIAAVLDFEFTNSMRAQFAYDPPWWLSLRHPGVLIEEEGIDDFVKNYTPRLEQFLRATERAEDKVGSMSTTEPLLSVRMREAWESMQFWFNYVHGYAWMLMRCPGRSCMRGTTVMVFLCSTWLLGRHFPRLFRGKWSN
jgi:hypothetical protein